MSEPARLPVTLVTGFLGSGKTTLINRALRLPELGDAAVIVNELGDAGIDNLLLERLDASTALLESGCVCCTVRDELALTMEDLLRRRDREEIPRFARLVIETTGLADPGPVARLLLTEPQVATRYALASVVTTVDAVNGLATLARHPEAVRQVVLADRLVITKTDLGGDAAVLEEGLALLNPAAPRAPAAEDEIDARLFDGAGWADPPEYATERHHHHALSTFTLVRDEALTFTQLSRWLVLLGELGGDDLLRVKGLVDVAGRPGPAVVHGVQRLVHVPTVLDAWPSEDRRTRIVCITHDIDRARIEGLLEVACAASAANASG